MEPDVYQEEETAATQRRKMLCNSRRGKFIVFVYRMQFLFYFRYNFFLILDINYNILLMQFPFFLVAAQPMRNQHVARNDTTSS